MKSGYESQFAKSPLTTVSALDIKELLHANVSPESCLGGNQPVSPDQFQGNLVCHDGGVAMGDVGKGTSVDKHRSAFCRWIDNSILTFTSILQILINSLGGAGFFEVGRQH